MSNIVFKGITKIVIDTRFPRKDRVSIKCTSEAHAEKLREVLAKLAVEAESAIQPLNVAESISVSDPPLPTPEQESRDADASRNLGL